MVPQPMGQNAQVQRLTTALKNICRDYPAGGTVLRELLQNADDAGATEVRFVLDENSYLVEDPARDLLHPKLEKYQGPALLAYNNAVFTDKDFVSLSRLGDSLKLDDGSTTGKFGRGFNSVYNWTDSPSIVSRERLLILDPHCEWSPGGPVYDFVKDSSEAAIQNHMAALGMVVDRLDRPLDGTIIRIPLRTKSQAAKSEISNRETTVSDLMEVLQSFASEFGENGLIFMRNIEKLELRSSSLSVKIQIVEPDKVRPHKLKINNAVKQGFMSSQSFFDHSFEMEVEHKSTGNINKTRFVIHHSIQCGRVNKKLSTWAKQQNYIPWVAVAGRFATKTSEVVNGSLFTVLPLPIPTNQPVHIHGLFSISPDRARLYQHGEKSAQDQEPANWNKYLLQALVPVAWTKLLSYMAAHSPQQSNFETWPQSLDDPRDPLDAALKKVTEIIGNESLAVWSTEVGYKTEKTALLATGLESDHLKTALREAQVPVVNVPERLYAIAKNIFKKRLLCPETLCLFLKGVKTQIKTWSNETKHAILEYVLSKPGFTGYDDLDIFPFKNGTYRSIGKHVAYVHRDSVEEVLFGLGDDINLDLGKLSKSAQQALKRGCETSKIHPSIRFRTQACLKEYCLRTIFKTVTKDQDFADLDTVAAKMVPKVWTWISARSFDLGDQEIACLWLLPLSNGQYRKIQPHSSSSHVYFAPPGKIGKLMADFNGRMVTDILPLLVIAPTNPSHILLSSSTRSGETLSILAIWDTRQMVFFLQWLRQTWDLVTDITDIERKLVTELIFSQSAPKSATPEYERCAEDLKHLPMFQKVSWTESDNKSSLTFSWTTLSSCGKNYRLLDSTNPVPDIDNVQYLASTSNSHSSQIIQKFELAKDLNPEDLIQDHIIKAWGNDKARNWSASCKDRLARFVLGRFSLLSDKAQAILQKLPMIPVSQLNGMKTSKFATAGSLIDPSSSELKGLCFDDEEIIPEASFLGRFKVAMVGCDLKTVVDEVVIGHRIRCYASNMKYSLQDRQKRAQNLLKSSCRWPSSLTDEVSSDLQCLGWLPVIDLSGIPSLKASHECRSSKDRLLVSSQLAILDTSISSNWETRLGWHETLPGEVLLSQLRFGVERKDRNILDAVLTYISEKDLEELLLHDLVDIPCVVISSSLFACPSQTFRPPKSSTTSYNGLKTYLANVDGKFWRDHRSLLTKLGVGDELQPSDLLKVQAILEGKAMLDEGVLEEGPDLGVAIELAKLASHFTRTDLANLKVISEARMFHPIQDISYDDLGPLKSKESVILTHPDIPRSTIQLLGIGSLRERLVKGMLEIEDVDDEDEFDQREKVTTRIADTLDRYSVEATFREYLANAEDTEGASRVAWLLDEREHPTQKLLTAEMKSLQGPALLVYNDGVFSDDDFRGFKNVGEGSKAHDKTSIGQFGRGSQTMYHWTDVPMILSGRYLLILDPQQEVLPKNQIKATRKPGVKLQISKLRDACGDQLAPFEGLWNYTQGLDYYPGTIFRFPLRTASTSSNSALKNSIPVLDKSEAHRLMAKYFDEARVSLLFLKRIKSIDFKIYGQQDSGWSTTRLQPLEGTAETLFKSVIVQFTWKPNIDAPISGKDVWWIATQGLAPVTDGLVDDSKRVMKNTECGIAALISSTIHSNPSNIPPTSIPKVTSPRMYNRLPLQIHSDLPVHVHGTFALSGDRQSLERDEHGSQSRGAICNNGLLQEALPNLYLSFLESAVLQASQGVFKFWPRETPPKRSSAECLCTSLWEKLSQSSQHLFPKAQATLGAPQGRPPEVFNVAEAVFDFLPPSQSGTLAPFLIAVGVKLVRGLPEHVVKQLKALPDVKSVTGPMLRTLLKSERARTCLTEEMRKNQQIFQVLSSMVLPISAEIHELNGCHIVPLANGTLSTLEFKDTSKDYASRYFVVSEAELKLFEFAARFLVKAAIGAILKPVLDNGKFNLSTLKRVDVRNILEIKPGVAHANDAEDKWLKNFWKYWNSNINPLMPLPNLDALSAKIYRGTLADTPFYASPSSLDALSAVVEPVYDEHKQLCARFPGLRIFDPKFMPKSLTDIEGSFYDAASFNRFIRSIKSLSGRGGIGTFVKTHLGADDLKVLQRLVMFYLSNARSSHNSTALPTLNADLNEIPLWPVFDDTSSPNAIIPANGALMVENTGLLVPWMKFRGKFLLHSFSSQNQECLIRLGVKKLSIEELLQDYILPLPSVLDALQLQGYQQLVAAISGSFVATDWNLINNKIAADGNCQLRKVSELYDHDDQIFKSAFRHQQSTRFLHVTVQHYRTLWVRLGLRHKASNFNNVEDYLECLRVLKTRLSVGRTQNDVDLEHDSQKILAPLIAPNSSIRKLSNGDWQRIAQEKVFRTRTDFSGEPTYRHNAMAILANNENLLCLSEIVLSEHAAVCWTQTPFARQQPTKEALAQVSGLGEPSVNMVLEHLQNMKILSEDLTQIQVCDFLVDLDRTYTYLQDHLSESRAAFSLGNIAIWLNLDTCDYNNVQLEDIESSWQGIEHLVLSSSVDAGQIKAVRPGLMRFEKLLRLLGCSSITYPTINRPTLHHGNSMSKSLRQLRKEEKLLDITYSTEGRQIKAHKVVLAAMSEKCAHQFNSRWVQEDVISYDETTDPEDFMSYHTLSTMIAYAYEEDISWKEMEVSDDDDDDTRATKLDLLLDLHKGADCWLVPALKSEVEDKILVAGKAFVNLSNVVEVKERAEAVRAMSFAAWCATMIAENQHIVDKAHRRT